MKEAVLFLLCFMTSGCLLFGSLTGNAHPQAQTYIPHDAVDALTNAGVAPEDFGEHVREELLPSLTQDTGTRYCLLRVDIPAGHAMICLLANRKVLSQLEGGFYTNSSLVHRVVEESSGNLMLEVFDKVAWGTDMARYETRCYDITKDGLVFKNADPSSLSYGE